MAAVDLDLSGTPATPTRPFQGYGADWLYKKEVDFSVEANHVAQDAVIALCKVEAGVRIDEVVVKVVTPEGATATADIGPYTGLPADPTPVDADGFLDGVNLNSAAYTSSKEFALTEAAPNTIAPAMGVNGYIFKTAGFIGMVALNALDAAVIEVYVRGIKFA